MALLEQAEDTKTFEMEDSEIGNDTGAGTATNTAAAVEIQSDDTPKSTAVAVKSSSAVAVRKENALVAAMTKSDPFKALEQAIKVDWNTLPRLQVNQGKVLGKDNDEDLGEWIVADLVSFQPNWMIATGADIDDEKAKPYIKYSNDGIHERETGRPMAEFVEAAIEAGYEKARITERVVLVGELIASDKKSDLVGQLFQCDMAPNSKRNFETHKIQAAFQVAKKRLNAEVATVAKITAKPMKDGNKKWTDAVFSMPEQAILDKVLAERTGGEAA